MTLPLAGLKIAVTRPRDQAAQLARSIEQAGGVPLLFPLLEIAAAQDSQALHEQISRLAQFDLAIFISPNAVRYGVEAIRAVGADNVGAQFIARFAQTNRAINCAPTSSSAINEGGLSPSLKIATVGQGSAKALRELGITDIIAPTGRFDSEGLLALPELQNVSGWRVMIFRGDGGRELLGDTLKARGAMVEYAACYQRSKSQLDVQALLEAKPDAISVSSSEALGHLWEMLDDRARAALRDMPLFVPHARIAVLAREQGWQHVHLTGSGDDGLLSGLMAWAANCRMGEGRP
jgi:uroporphyrinogen-III synthase